jgi:hypothetical protein
MSGHSPRGMKILTTDFTDLHRFFLNPCPSVLICVPIFSGVPWYEDSDLPH